MKLTQEEKKKLVKILARSTGFEKKLASGHFENWPVFVKSSSVPEEDKSKRK